MPKGTLEIGVYEPSAQLAPALTEGEVAATFIHNPNHPSPQPRIARYAVVGAGALTSFFLHALVLTFVIWGGHHASEHPPKPSDLHARGNPGEPNEGLSMELVSIEDDAGVHTDDRQTLSAPVLMPVSVQAALTNANIASVSGFDGMSVDAGDTDGTAHALLVGRYLGQINARVERAWRRPRIPVREGVFSCRVRIEQDTQGGVEEITLEHCNGDAQWQVSLVHAIQLASPLPSPPDPAVFSRVLRMDFRAEPSSDP